MRFYGYRVGGTPLPLPHEIVSVGDAHGRIAVYLNKQEAIDLASMYGSGDAAAKELLAAVEQAYPSAAADEPGETPFPAMEDLQHYD